MPKTPRKSSTSAIRGLEVLENRELLTLFTVTNRQNAGAGSLRQAIIAANQDPGFDVIDFGVAGTIKVGPTSLPALTGPVTIDGSTAPSFASSPVVTINFRGTSGLNFQKGAIGSTLRSLSLIGAGDSGVTISASDVTVEGNFIGLRPDGTTIAGNRGDGVRITASSHGDLIGRSDPVTSISYYNTDTVGVPVSGWTGIRPGDASGQYLITGNSGSNGLLYDGPISGSGSSGTTSYVNVPGADSTNVYGPDNLNNGALRLVGT
jgi:hypothetical protein